jgi:hypothetical protein
LYTHLLLSNTETYQVVLIIICVGVRVEVGISYGIWKKVSGLLEDEAFWIRRLFA